MLKYTRECAIAQLTRSYCSGEDQRAWHYSIEQHGGSIQFQHLHLKIFTVLEYIPQASI
jgi:hypothetical protein